MRKLCIYHGGCTDGVAAAWAVWKAHSDCVFYPGVYGKEPPLHLVDDDTEVILVDFSYKRPVLESIIEEAGNVIVLDHHKTAARDLEPLLNGGLVVGEFDMDRCGAMMAWDYFHNSADRPALLKLIDAQDRWLPTRDAPTIMALRSYPHRPADESQWAWDELMTVWDGLMTVNGLRRLREDGLAIHRYYRQRVDETKPHAAPMTIGEYRDVPVVNAPYYLASDVAGELAEDADVGIAACWWRNRDGSVTFSLRSCGGVDVAALAEQFGGGGHAGAAGFRVASLSILESMYEQQD